MTLEKIRGDLGLYKSVLSRMNAARERETSEVLKESDGRRLNMRKEGGEETRRRERETSD